MSNNKDNKELYKTLTLLRKSQRILDDSFTEESGEDSDVEKATLLLSKNKLILDDNKTVQSGEDSDVDKDILLLSEPQKSSYDKTGENSDVEKATLLLSKNKLILDDNKTVQSEEDSDVDKDILLLSEPQKSSYDKTGENSDVEEVTLLLSKKQKSSYDKTVESRKESTQEKVKKEINTPDLLNKINTELIINEHSYGINNQEHYKNVKREREIEISENTRIEEIPEGIKCITESEGEKGTIQEDSREIQTIQHQSKEMKINENERAELGIESKEKDIEIVNERIELLKKEWDFDDDNVDDDYDAKTLGPTGDKETDKEMSEISKDVDINVPLDIIEEAYINRSRTPIKNALTNVNSIPSENELLANQNNDLCKSIFEQNSENTVSQSVLQNVLNSVKVLEPSKFSENCSDINQRKDLQNTQISNIIGIKTLNRLSTEIEPYLENKIKPVSQFSRMGISPEVVHEVLQKNNSIDQNKYKQKPASKLFYKSNFKTYINKLNHETLSETCSNDATVITDADVDMELFSDKGQTEDSISMHSEMFRENNNNKLFRRIPSENGSVKTLIKSQIKNQLSASELFNERLNIEMSKKCKQEYKNQCKESINKSDNDTTNELSQQYCPLCKKNYSKLVNLQFYQISIDKQLLLCPTEKCRYPYDLPNTKLTFKNFYYLEDVFKEADKIKNVVNKQMIENMMFDLNILKDNFEKLNNQDYKNIVDINTIPKPHAVNERFDIGFHNFSRSNTPNSYSCLESRPNSSNEAESRSSSSLSMESCVNRPYSTTQSESSVHVDIFSKPLSSSSNTVSTSNISKSDIISRPNNLVTLESEPISSFPNLNNLINTSAHISINREEHMKNTLNIPNDVSDNLDNFELNQEETHNSIGEETFENILEMF